MDSRWNMSLVFMCDIKHCVLCFASDCELCKCWARSSGQAAGQMRKQMDQFGLNPSHGISSPWPSTSNLHVFTEEKVQNASIYVWFGGGELHVLLQVPTEKVRWLWARRVFATIYNRPCMFTLDCNNTCLFRICLSCKAKWQCPGNKYPHGAHTHLIIKLLPLDIFSIWL